MKLNFSALQGKNSFHFLFLPDTGLCLVITLILQMFLWFFGFSYRLFSKILRIHVHTYGLLVFSGCCQDMFLIYYLDGVIGWARINRRSGIWFLASFGLYGGNVTLVFLRMQSTQFHSFMNFFLILCMIGLQFGAIPAPILSILFQNLCISLDCIFSPFPVFIFDAHSGSHQ